MTAITVLVFTVDGS